MRRSATNGGDSWSWRAADGEEAGLLYEPGNWGDVLKGTWALVTLRSILAAEARGTLRYLDVCAGQPTYPRSAAAARREERLAGSVFRKAQAPFAAARCVASTAMLVREACAAAGRRCELQVFDADPARREKWVPIDGARVLDVSCGEDALASAAADFALVDPYDFFDHWGRWVPGALELAQRAPVLIYLYNKSPRGAGFVDQYRRLRAQLRSGATGGTRALLGRLASDARSPRAYHEVVLVGPAERLLPVRSALLVETQRLAEAVGDDGDFEEIDGTVDKL